MSWESEQLERKANTPFFNFFLYGREKSVIKEFQEVEIIYVTNKGVSIECETFHCDTTCKEIIEFFNGKAEFEEVILIVRFEGEVSVARYHLDIKSWAETYCR